MPTATAPYNAAARQGQNLALPVAASTTLYTGCLAALNTSGYVVPATDTAGLQVIGRVESGVVNSGSAGDKTVNLFRGVLNYTNSATNPCGITHIGKIVFIEDDTTVATTSTNKVKAGRCLAVDANGTVWVDTTMAHVIPAAANTITAAADLAALKTALDTLLRNAGLII